MFVMLLAVSVSLCLIGSAAGQIVNCPTQEAILGCTNYVKDLADRLTVPTHNIFTSKTFFITPLDWSFYETEEVCKVKNDYKQFLLCAVQLLKDCVLDDRRDPFMSGFRINRAVEYLCSSYKCNDCTRLWCERCGDTRYFDYSCTKQRYPELSTCMKPYENEHYVPPSSDLTRRREEFNDWQCRLVEHHRSCTYRAYKSCGTYTANITNWYMNYARPAVCSAPSVSLSAIIVLFTVILATLK